MFKAVKYPKLLVMEMLNFSRLKSIRSKFAIPVMFVTMIVLIVGGMIRFNANRNEYIKELNTRTETILQLAVLANKEPLWNYSLDSLKANGEALLQDQEVCMVTIRDAEGKMLYTKTKRGVISNNYYLISKEQAIIYQNRNIGFVKIGMTTYFQRQKIWGELYSNILMIVFTFLLLWGAISYVSVLVTKPIKRIITSTANAAKGDLTDHIEVTTKDEIAIMADGFNSMIKSLREMIFQITSVSQTIAASAEEFFALADTSKSTVKEVVITSQEIAKRTEEQSHNMAEIDDMVQETSQSMNLVVINSVETSALSQNSYNVAIESCNTVGKAISKIQDISQVIDETLATVEKLDEFSDRITSFIELITNISSQVNLLGLNAAIEAARAGENGRGFAVVAQEISKLSEETTRATKQINDIVNEIRSSIKNAVSMMAMVSKIMEEENDLTKNAEGALQEIVSATKKASQIAEQIEMAAKQQAENSATVTEKIQVVTEISHNTAASSQEAFSVMEEYAQTIKEIIAAAENLAKTSEELVNVTEHFKY